MSTGWLSTAPREMTAHQEMIAETRKQIAYYQNMIADADEQMSHLFFDDPRYKALQEQRVQLQHEVRLLQAFLHGGIGPHTN